MSHDLCIKTISQRRKLCILWPKVLFLPWRTHLSIYAYHPWVMVTLQDSLYKKSHTISCNTHITQHNSRDMVMKSHTLQTLSHDICKPCNMIYEYVTWSLNNVTWSLNNVTWSVNHVMITKLSVNHVTSSLTMSHDICKSCHMITKQCHMIPKPCQISVNHVRWSL